MAVKKRLIFAILVVGATSIVAQIVLLRELISVFYGNEISIGIMLAGWLILGTLGSLVLGRFADKVKDPAVLFSSCQLALSVILPCMIIAVRLIKRAFGFLPGEILPLWTLLSSVPLVLAGCCIILGFLFALSCRAYPGRDGSLRIGNVYTVESIGAAAGGLITSFFLIRMLSSSQILTALGIMNLISSLVLLNSAAPSRAKNIVRASALFLSCAALSFVLSGGPARLEKATRDAQWSPLRVILSKDSVYGNITITETGSSVSFFNNGLHNFTMPDRLTQEEAVHFSLLQHPDPKEILLIGGGAGGLLWEILRHPVHRVHYVELDPLIIKLSRKYLGGAKYYALDDPRVLVVNYDGRSFVRRGGLKYDAVIIQMPNPYTAQLNRFYSKEFYLEAKNAMNDGAVLSFGVTSSENYIANQLGRFLGSIHNTLKEVFADIVYIPGDTAYFIASRRKGLLTSDHAELVSRLRSRGIEAGFVNENYLFSKLSPGRLDYMRSVLEEHSAERKNYDFTPVSYYYDMILWSAHFGSGLGRVYSFITRQLLWGVFILAYAAILAAGYLARKKRADQTRPVLTAIAATGFSEITFEIVVVLAFQITYGYLYYKLGLILTSFMIGLFLGSAYITKRLGSIKDHTGYFKNVLLAASLYPFILPVIFSLMVRAESPQASWLGANVIFPALPAVAGFIGGLQFPLGNRICLNARHGAGRTGGLTYGVDLLGASLGAVIVSAFMIPCLGVFQTCAAVGLLNASALLGINLSEKKKGRIR